MKLPKLHFSILTFLMIQNLSFGQFEKFKSTTDFNPDKMEEARGPENLSDEESAFIENEESYALENENYDDVGDNPNNNGNSYTPPSNQAGMTSDQNTFGSRPANQAVTKDNKVVSLNPETGFGPEIITSFDFPDTDILDLTKHMQKLTGINLILDKEVKGKISITAPTAITVGDAWKAYLAALNMANFTIVKSGAFYKVIPAREVRYTPTSIYTGNYTPNTEAHVMKVITLKNVSAEEISRNFRPFMTKYGRMMDIKQTNTIIVSDTGTNIQRLERMIQFLDVPGHDESLHIIPVKHTSAQEIAKLLDTILQDSGSGGGRGGSRNSRRSSPPPGGDQSSAGISKIIAEPRTNSIIAMANASGFEKLTELIKKLDVKLISSSSGKVHVYYLNFGNAEELAKTLSSLIQGSTKTNSKNSPSSRRFSSGDEDVDTAIFNAEVKITADKNNNALVVTASPTDWLTLKNVIGKLDIPRSQVYVEGMILETNITRNKSFGVEYVGAYGEGNAQRGGFTTDGSLTNLLATGQPTNLSGFFLGGGGPETKPREFEIGGQKVKINSVNGLIKALSTASNTNVLSTPQILAMDNTEAVFEVGESIPIQETTTANNGSTTNSTKYVDATLKLEIKPQINKATRMIKLNIKQKIDDFKEAQAGSSGQPKFTRSAQTEVLVHDKDTIAMGGLMKDREVEANSKVPLLGDIPVLGWLFKSKRKQVDKINLIFFMTPTILSPYNPLASTNTKEIINRREEHFKGVFTHPEDDIAHKQLQKTLKKVEEQEKATYGDEVAVNEQNIAAPENTAPQSTTDTPNYQEIVEEIKQKNEEN